MVATLLFAAESVTVTVAVSFPFEPQVTPEMLPLELTVMPTAFGNDALVKVYGAVPPEAVRKAVLLYVVPWSMWMPADIVSVAARAGRTVDENRRLKTTRHDKKARALIVRTPILFLFFVGKTKHAK